MDIVNAARTWRASGKITESCELVRKGGPGAAAANADVGWQHQPFLWAEQDDTGRSLASSVLAALDGKAPRPDRNCTGRYRILNRPRDGKSGIVTSTGALFTLDWSRLPNRMGVWLPRFAWRAVI
jgi:hypothetical protein